MFGVKKQHQPISPLFLYSLSSMYQDEARVRLDMSFTRTIMKIPSKTDIFHNMVSKPCFDSHSVLHIDAETVSPPSPPLL